MSKAAAKALSNTELSAFCGQMALILKSGISATEGIDTMLEDTEDPEEQAILNQIRDQLFETNSLYESLKATGLYPGYLLQMVRIGEETGTLDEVLDGLSRHYEREEAIARTIRNSITFPAIMAVMMLIVIFVLLVRVMPVFNQVYRQLGTEMTGFSKALLNIGSAIDRYSFVLIILAVLVAVFVLYGTRTDSGKKFFKKIGHAFPFIRRMNERLSVCRFTGGMALGLKSGLDSEQSLGLAADLCEDEDFSKKLKQVQEDTAAGADFAQALHRAEVVSGISARMVSIGSKTGTMPEVMDRIAQLTQDEIDTRLNNILSKLEPILVIVLSVIVGAILLSVMLPLMGIMSSI